jgi:hypothetical protein
MNQAVSDGKMRYVFCMIPLQLGEVEMRFLPKLFLWPVQSRSVGECCPTPGRFQKRNPAEAGLSFANLRMRESLARLDFKSAPAACHLS